MKIVVNKNHCGFELSNTVFEWLIKNKGWEITKINDEGNLEDETKPIEKHKTFEGKVHYDLTSHSDKIRSNTDLIEAIEFIGINKAQGFAELKIIEIPDDVDYEIDNYDGMESIHEKHRSWS